MSAPWWVERADALSLRALPGLALGPLWRLCRELDFVRDTVEPAMLPVDFAATLVARGVWERFVQHALAARDALIASRGHESLRIAGGGKGPRAFRAGWESLAFEPNLADSGTPADDYLDGLYSSEARVPDSAPPELGNQNLATRARRVADFLAVVEPGPGDVVVDLGSGAGKLALTVSASTFTRVVGVEYCADSVQAARTCALGLGLANVRFDEADVRDFDFSQGSVFYLYHPFRDAVAQHVAEALGALARQKAIRVYSAGPIKGYGEHFLREVERGALVLRERRGEFSEAMVLASR